MEFQWSEAALIATDVPDNLNITRYISPTPRDNSTPAEARKIMKLLTDCGFVVTGIAATLPFPNLTEYTIPISIMESITLQAVHYDIRILHGQREQICNVGQQIHTLRSASNGSARNRLTMVIQDAWGQEAASGSPNKPLTQEQVDQMIPGVANAINYAAEAAVAGVIG